MGLSEAMDPDGLVNILPRLESENLGGIEGCVEYELLLQSSILYHSSKLQDFSV